MERAKGMSEKKERLVIIGASGHGKVIADIAILNGYKDIVFLDDDANIKECAGFPLVGATSEAEHLEGDKIIAIGNASVRKRMSEEITGLVTLVHPAASISQRVKLGAGTVVMAGAVINSDAVIGEGCIINTCASVDHDCKIGSFVHVAVGAHVAGAVTIGDSIWIGAGATVSNNVNICSDCMIGAGAVIVKDITEAGVYVGCPAERRIDLKKIEENRTNVRNGGQFE